MPGDLDAAAVHHQRAFFDAQVDMALAPGLDVPGHQRPHLGCRIAGRPTSRGDPWRQTFDQGIGGIVTDRDRDRDRRAAPAGRTVARAHQRIGGLLQVGIGHHHHVVLGAAQRLHAFAVRVPGLVDVLGPAVGADEADRRDFRMRQQGVDRLLVAIDHVQDAGRRAGLAEQFGRAQRGRRDPLGGILSTKVLPQAIAIGNIHIRTIAAQLNGVMPAQTPTGWRTEWLSTLVPTFSEKVPLSRCGAPQASLDHLDAAGERAACVVQHLAVLRRDQLRDLVGVSGRAVP